MYLFTAVPVVRFSAHSYEVVEGDTLSVTIERLRAASPFDYGLSFVNDDLSTATGISTLTKLTHQYHISLRHVLNCHRVEVSTYEPQ